MKKITVLIVFLLIILSPSAFASQVYEQALSGEIKEYGIFDGIKGVIYADYIELENTSLLIVRADGSTLSCSVYDDSDGLQLTDTIDLSCEGYRACRLVTVKSGGRNYIMFSRMSENIFYTIENDIFTRAEITDYYPVTSVAVSENGKIIPSVPENSVYNFLNRLKAQSMREYTFTNRLGSLSEDEVMEIKATLSACVDIMSFDIKNYDYDTVFKYILYTHENFKILTDIPPMSGESSTLGYNKVSLVSSEFIDYIMEKIFRITPEKPPVNSLTTRGFCYNNGYYLYTGSFEVYFATEIRDLIGVYDLGGNVIFVTFSDIYREGDRTVPEYSFAILQKTSEGYSLLRLGMGDSLPPQTELRTYSPFSAYGGSVWNSARAESNENKADFLLPILLVIFSVGTVGLVCSVVVILRTRRK